MRFNWNDGPLELVMGEAIYPNIKFGNCSDMCTTTIRDADDKYLTTVFYDSGDANGPTSAHYRKTYVRKMVIPIEAMSDEDLADKYRKLDAEFMATYNELIKRGYCIESDGEEVEFILTDRIYKYETIVKEL